MSKNRSLQNYEFVKTIGEGTFGKVKLAIHKLTEEQVAIKILEKAKIKNKKDLERIEKEIKYMKKLNHPNIVKIYEIFEDNDNFYISMEYVSGGELFNYIVKNKRLDENETSFFYSQIIHIIQEIHKYKICHRDLKPENLLLTQNKTIKLIDFGLSNEYENYLYTPCGSPCYASPEVIKGLKYSGLAIDLWASGIILFSMLCGYLPFDDKNNDKLFRKILKCKIEFPTKKINLSENAKDLIRKILRPDPSKRITLDEILEHPFLTYGNKKYKERINMEINKQDKLIIDYMVNVLKIKNDDNIIKRSIVDNKYNNYSTTFNLLKKKYNEGRLNYNIFQKNETDNLNRSSLLKRNNNVKLNRTLNSETNITHNNNSLAQDIGNIIKKKVTENNNIIIINNNNNLVNQPHILDSLFTENKNIVKEKYKKILKNIDTSISIEKRRKENETINVSQSPGINYYKANAFKYNPKMRDKRIFYKKYINTSMNQNQIYNQNDSTFRADSINLNLKEKSQEKNMNLNLKGYNEYKKKIIPSSHLKTLTNLQYYTLNNKEKDNQYNTRISLKNKSLINSLLFGKNERNNLNSSVIKRVPQYNQNLYRRSPYNKINTKYYNYFYSVNDTSGELLKYEKLNEINNKTSNSLFNEIKPEFNNENNNIRTTKNNKDKIKYYIISNLNNKDEKKNTLENNKIKKILQIGKENFYKKLDIKKLKEERKKIRVNKLIPLQDKSINNNIDISNNLSERERYPKSIYFNKANKNKDINNITENKMLKFRLKELTEKKLLNNSIAYSRKICPQNKSFAKTNNYLEISTNLNIYQISNRINKFCQDKQLFYNQTNNKYNIIIKQINSFSIEINTLNESNILKFTHEKGDEINTKKYMIELYSEIAK